jgi:hypothetical protein
MLIIWLSRWKRVSSVVDVGKVLFRIVTCAFSGPIGVECADQLDTGLGCERVGFLVCHAGRGLES